MIYFLLNFFFKLVVFCHISNIFHKFSFTHCFVVLMTFNSAVLQSLYFNMSFVVQYFNNIFRFLLKYFLFIYLQPNVFREHF